MSTRHKMNELSKLLDEIDRYGSSSRVRELAVQVRNEFAALLDNTTIMQQWSIEDFDNSIPGVNDMTLPERKEALLYIESASRKEEDGLTPRTFQTLLADFLAGR